MNRPVTLVLAAVLIASSPAFAGTHGVVGKIARQTVNPQGNNSGGGNHGNHGGNSGGSNHGGNGGGGNHGGHDGNHGGGAYRPAPGNPGNGHGNDHGRGNDHGNHGNHGNWNDNRHDRDHDNGSHYNWNTRDNRGWDHYRNDWNQHPHYWDNRRHDRVDYARYRFHTGHYYAPHGYYHRVWVRGAYLPRAWYGPRYIIHDYHPYHLYAPPYGYSWVRVGNDVLLTALATGLVLDVIYDIWY